MSHPFSFTATFFFLSSILFLCHLPGPAFVFSRKKPPADHWSTVEWLLSLDILSYFFLCFFEAAAGIQSVALLPPSVFILPPFLYSAIPRGVDGSTLSTLLLQRFDLFLVAFSLSFIVVVVFLINFNHFLRGAKIHSYTMRCDHYRRRSAPDKTVLAL